MGKAHAKPMEQVMASLEASPHGLTHAEAAARLEKFGPNTLPRGKAPTLFTIFLRQFLSPLIYILLIAAIVSLFLREWSDAGFIFAVLLINAIIGTYQEFTAQRSALALQTLVTTRTRVERAGDAYEINALELVPGDIVLLEPGSKVPADLRLLDTRALETDESLLTGESIPVNKDPQQVLAADCLLADRLNMTFAGTMVTHGRGRAVVVGTGLATELGHIASAVFSGAAPKAPLVVRMDRFVFRIAILVGLAALLLAAVALYRGTPLNEIFLLAVALAVSAIPEGLPVALTVALAVGMERMARRNVIVRRLIAVEALGSCTFIASDKTGTLTVNELTARVIQFPNQPPWQITGEGTVPEGTIITPPGAPPFKETTHLQRLCETVVLANEGTLAHRDGTWTHHGDMVDVALLVMAHKAGFTQPELLIAFPQIADIPFEPEYRCAASLNRAGTRSVAFVKGALETLLPMCATMAAPANDAVLNPSEIEQAARSLAADGYRVLAFAQGEITLQPDEVFSLEHLRNLTFLGLVGMIDPLRPEAKDAVAACQQAGVEVAMVTGDHPDTALTIARDLQLARDSSEVVTGTQLAKTVDDAGLDTLTANARVFARVEPRQKLDIVQSLYRQGHFVAVTGDGANDAPALRAAQVGVAMGQKGTDVARETADLIVTDDNFASIVAGIEEGRVAYGNVRKVIFLLISTGAAEIVLFILALLTGLPLPLMAVQLLWLNLVTNGIQDVALAFEPAEGGELGKPPRPPKEPIFNRLMTERVVLSALVIGGLAFGAFYWLLQQGYTLEQARNSTLLLMVLFENVQAFNSRSETLSVFRHNPLRNRLLLFGTLIAQLVHIGAMYTPGLRDILDIEPITLAHWAQLLCLALVLSAAMELQKLVRKARG